MRVKWSRVAMAKHLLGALERHPDFYARHPELAHKLIQDASDLKSGVRAVLTIWHSHNAWDRPESTRHGCPVAVVGRMIPRVNRNTKGKRIENKTRKGC